LTLTADKIRKETSTTGGYVYTGPEDSRFQHNYIGQSISTSGGQNDSGVFELNLRDERYLPFEGRGAISDWNLKLTSAVPTFDWSTITDVVLHVRYTAREGGDLLRNAAVAALTEGLAGLPLRRGFSAKHEFPTEWNAFLRPAQGVNEAIMRLDLSEKRFPHFARYNELKISEVELIALTKNTNGQNQIDVQVVSPAGDNPVTLNSENANYGGHPSATVTYDGGISPGQWTVTVPTTNLGVPSGWIDDLVVIATYQMTVST
jgi:hypothetical protein